VFPNEKRELSVGCTENRRVGRWAAEKGGPAEKGGLEMCRTLACPVVQPASPPFCAARQPVENSCVSFGNMALQPTGPLFSVIP